MVIPTNGKREAKYFLHIVWKGMDGTENGEAVYSFHHLAMAEKAMANAEKQTNCLVAFVMTAEEQRMMDSDTATHNAYYGIEG